MSESFTIIKVSWLTQTPGNTARRDEIIEHVYRISRFLQKNNLTVGKTILKKEDITDDFELSSADLNEEGLLLMRTAYDRWLTKVDSGMSPEDVTILEKALQKIQGTQRFR